MKIDLLDKTKKKDILKSVGYLGEIKTNELFIRTGDRIRTYSGNLTNEEIKKIWSMFPIEGIGLYLAKDYIKKNNKRETRLSLDGIHKLKEQIKKNIIEINEEQANKWFRGNNLELTNKQAEIYRDMEGFVVLKYKEDFVGTAKLFEKRHLLSFLPKERRIKN
jgi:NOL1/NOP2/fmu family ribosome biogenesis protein